MDTIGERLLYLINTQGVSMKKFCEKNGLSYQSINPICNNKREIGIQIIHDLMKIFPSLNINWLIYGTGTANYTISGTDENIYLLEEPPEKLNYDPLEETILHYLDNKNVRNKVKEIIKEEIK
jgi:transcriptional regulator with XRE-family HTH domain